MKHCKHYLPWTVTYSVGGGQHEINDACVNNEKRTIKRCDFCRDHSKCPDYKTED